MVKYYFYRLLVSISILNLVSGGIFFSNSFVKVFAGALTTLSNTQSSLSVSNSSSHTIRFITPSGVAPGEAISVTFPLEYVMGTFNITNFDLATSTGPCLSFGDELLATSPLGNVWGVTQVGQSITFTSDTATILPGSCIEIQIGDVASFGGLGVNQVNNPLTEGQYSVSLGGSFGDIGLILQHIISNDAVVVSGTVDQELTFTISTSTMYFGVLDANFTKYASSTNIAGDVLETSAHSLSISSNAASGFTITVRGPTLTSLQNPANTITAIGAISVPSVAGNEQFGIRATESGGTGVTIASTFSDPVNYGYHGLASSSVVFVTGIGATLTSTIDLFYVANIAQITEAGIYATNLTYVATANF